MSNAMRPPGRGDASGLSTAPWHSRWLERGCPADPIPAPPSCPMSISALPSSLRESKGMCGDWELWGAGRRAAGLCPEGQSRAGGAQTHGSALLQPGIGAAPPAPLHTLPGCRQQHSPPRSCAHPPAPSETSRELQTPLEVQTRTPAHPIHVLHIGSPYFLNER